MKSNGTASLSRSPVICPQLFLIFFVSGESWTKQLGNEISVNTNMGFADLSVVCSVLCQTLTEWSVPFLCDVIWWEYLHPALYSLHFWCFWVVWFPSMLHDSIDGVIFSSWVKGWVWRLSGVLSPCGGSSLHHPPAQPRWASNELPPAPASSQWGASEATV